MKKLLILILFILSLNLVYAAEINVKESSVKSIILPGQNAIFDLEVTNNQAFRDQIKSVIMDSNWKRQGGNEVYNLNANEKVQDRLTLFPLGYLKPGIYAIGIRFVSTTNPEIYMDKQIVITIIDYKDILEAKLEANPQGLDPRKDNLVKLNLKSRYNINLENIAININNNLFNKDIITNVNGLETKTEEFIISLDPSTIEGDYDTKVIIKYGNEILVNKVEKLIVSSYSDLKETKTEEFSFFIKETAITRMNDGNSLSNEIYTLTLSSFEKLFTEFNPAPSNIEETNKGNKYEWRFRLQPGEEYKIIVTHDYRTPLIILIVIFLLVYLFYKYFYAEMSINKRALVLKSQEGGIAGVKILINIKNNGPSVRSLHLVEEIPSELDLPHEYITLKPSSIRKTNFSSIVIWEIPELIRGEERIISYKLKSKTGHKGKLLIPRTSCRYKNNMGKLSVAKSNEVVISS